MTTKRTRAARNNLLRILPRATLEALSNLDRPHMASIQDLRKEAINNWDRDAICDAIETILLTAAGDD